LPAPSERRIISGPLGPDDERETASPPSGESPP
jgi:hypothetical protein